MNTARKQLVNDIQASLTLDDFKVAESLLVMYDAGVVFAYEMADGQSYFMVNDKATVEQHKYSESIQEYIREAPNDVWSQYVFGDHNAIGGTC